MLGRWSEARAAARDALAARDPVVRAWAHWNRGKLDDKAGRYAAAAQAYRRAIAIARAPGIPEWEARDITAWSLWALGWVAIRTGTSEEALARLREASAAAPSGDAGVHLWIAHGLAHV
ncbi:MAG TPA: hypothetical protein VFM19_00060, partial [Candidatus Limnocylindria bacterium]|nr:hypothetical protein [Candidatus Limnocylindria bacterium]